MYTARSRIAWNLITLQVLSIFDKTEVYALFAITARVATLPVKFLKVVEFFLIFRVLESRLGP